MNNNVNKMIALNIVIILGFLKLSETSTDTIIEIGDGKIRGRNNGNYYSFESIPYAEPPIGKNRFESPVPILKGWDNILDATNPPKACLQFNYDYEIGYDIEGEEDCLYLNVYTPNIQGNEQFPVIVHIHGGGFMTGRIEDEAEKLIMKHKNTVVVLFNYRLGPIGFLSTGDDQIAGNMGLKDQQLVLRWVQENIHAFNGNPEKVLVSGFSAGGASVHLHLLNKETQKLVSAAASFSAAALCPWVIDSNFLNKTNKLSAILQCPTDDTKAIKDCMQKQPIEEFVASVKQFYSFLYNPFRIFGPVIESSSVKDAFLTKEPKLLLQEGNIAKVPWLVSYTKEDGGHNAANLLRKSDQDDEYINEFIEKFDELAPIVLFYDEKMSDQEEINYTAELRIKYQITQEDSILEKYWKITDLLTNEIAKDSILKSLRMHSDFSEAPVYCYLYDSTGTFGLANIAANRTDIEFGSVHGDDVSLIFNSPLRENYPFSSDEEKISDKLINMMYSFAISNVLKYDALEVPKNEANSGKVTYLKISQEKTSIVIEDLENRN